MSVSNSGVVAFWIAVVLIGIVLATHRDSWRDPKALFLIALVLLGVPRVVPMPDRVHMSFSVLSIMFSGWAVYRFVRDRRLPAKPEH